MPPPSIEFLNPQHAQNVIIQANGTVKVSFAIYNTFSTPSVNATANGMPMLGMPAGMPVFFNGGWKYEFVFTPPVDPANPPHPLAPPFNVTLKVGIDDPQKGKYSGEIEFGVSQNIIAPIQRNGALPAGVSMDASLT